MRLDLKRVLRRIAGWKFNWRSLVRYLLLALTAALLLVFGYITFVWGPRNFPPSVMPYLFALSGVLFGLSIASFAIMLWETLKRRPTIIKRIVRLRITKPLFEELAVKFIARSRRLRRHAMNLSALLQKDVIRSGRPANPYRLVATAFFATFISAVLFTALAVCLALTVSPLFIVLMFVPLVFLFYPTIKLKLAVGDRKRNSGDELPLFALYASILQSAGLSLYSALRLTMGKKVFSEFEKDAAMAERNVTFFAKTPIEAVNELGRLHPNPDVKLFYIGYASEWHSGGDLTLYLESKARDLLKDMRFKWARYSQRASDWGEMIIALLFLVPVMVLTSSFIFPAASMMMLVAFMTVGIPVITAVLYSMINLSQPKAMDEYEGATRLAALIGAVAAVLTACLGLPVWSILGAGLAAGMATYSLPVVFQMREVGQEERSLPAFLRDLTEYKKMGYSIVHGIRNVARAEPYTERFNAVVKYVNRQLELGIPLSSAVIPSRSWAVKTVFFILGQIVDTGGGTPRSLESLTDFVDEYIRIKKETRALMGTYRFLSTFTPIGLAFAVNLMYGLALAFAKMVSPAVAVGILPFSLMVPPAFLDINYLLVVVASTSVALLSTKTAEFTSKNTLWVAINVALAMVGILLSSPLVDYLMSVIQISV